MNKIILIVLTLCLNACGIHKSNTAQQQSWSLNSDLSTISILTTKNNSITEVSEFTSFNATIDENYKFNAVIDLKSLETRIPIRNERIQKHLFESEMFPSAEVHVQLRPEHLKDGVHDIKFDVDLHGVSNILHAEFLVLNKGDSMTVTLHKPFVVSADYFGMKQGVTTLQKIANLMSIDFTVPIHIILTFEKDK